MVWLLDSWLHHKFRDRKDSCLLMVGIGIIDDLCWDLGPPGNLYPVALHNQSLKSLRCEWLSRSLLDYQG